MLLASGLSSQRCCTKQEVGSEMVLRVGWHSAPEQAANVEAIMAVLRWNRAHQYFGSTGVAPIAREYLAMLRSQAAQTRCSGVHLRTQARQLVLIRIRVEPFWLCRFLLLVPLTQQVSQFCASLRNPCARAVAYLEGAAGCVW